MTSLLTQEPPAPSLPPASDKTVAPMQPQPRYADNWLALAALAVLGGISTAAYYLGFVQPYLLEDYYRRPLMDLAKINRFTASAANSWALTWIVLFAAYFFAFRLCPLLSNASRGFRRMALMVVCGWAAFFCLNLLFMYPVGAADLFGYIFQGRLISEYGLNPFVTVPMDIEGDPFLPYVAWRGETSHYGPLWELLAAGVSWLGGNDLWNNILYYKLLVTASHAANAALVYAILRDLRPAWTLKGLIFYAWNPLVIFEVPGNGHHDALVATFILLAIFFLSRALRWAVFPALMLGVLTKFIPALFFPLAAVAIWRDRTKRNGRGSPANGAPALAAPITHLNVLTVLLLGAGLSLVLAVILYWPFWVGSQSIGALNRGPLFTASIGKVVLDTLVIDLDVQVSVAQSWVRNAGLGLVALTALVLGLRIFFSRTAYTRLERHILVNRTLRAFYELCFVYLAFGTFWFQPWYLIWLVALAAPLASYTHAYRTMLFCIGGVLNYFVWDFIWLWNRADIRDNQITAALAIYTLPLFYTLYTLLRPLWSRSESASGPDGERASELSVA